MAFDHEKHPFGKIAPVQRAIPNMYSEADINVALHSVRPNMEPDIHLAAAPARPRHEARNNSCHLVAS